MFEVPHLCVNRLCVYRGGVTVYDERFHQGVNIIRGENGSGKSTISDFIFYILGGEFSDWKQVARGCNEVWAEINTTNGILTLRREIKPGRAPISVFFGAYEIAIVSAIEGWQIFPIYRTENQKSFTQILFSSMDVPESQSDGSSNITMHQVLRLLYGDQRTPAIKLFRFEQFDKQDIREAVGDLVCGLSGSEIYKIGLEIRALERKGVDLKGRYTILKESLSDERKGSTPKDVLELIAKLRDEKERTVSEIENVDSIVSIRDSKVLLKDREAARNEIGRERLQLNMSERAVEKNRLEFIELNDFLRFLYDLSHKLELADDARIAIGEIDFTHCPSCLSTLENVDNPDQCNVCGSTASSDEKKTKYNQIRFDLEVQQSETQQLIAENEIAQEQETRRLEILKKSHGDKLDNFNVAFNITSLSRDSFLAERNQRLGRIDGDSQHLLEDLQVLQQCEKILRLRTEIRDSIKQLEERKKLLETQVRKRRRIALDSISRIVSGLLQKDLDRQEEFQKAKVVAVDFLDNSIAVDGKMNFAESSNVYLKNATLLGILLAAGYDSKFFHPRFLLMDSVEDKGMETERSHLFQQLVVDEAKKLNLPHQIIFTTSMMNPNLESESYVIGKKYDSEKRTLQIVSFGSSGDNPNVPS